MTERAELLERLARWAMRFVREHVASPRVVHEKAPGDLVTDLDVLVERRLRQEITRQFPNDAVIGEEEDESGDAATAEWTWVLDPIDGTANLARGLPLYAVSLTVVDRESARHTAVTLPALEAMFRADRHVGAWTYASPHTARTTLRVSDNPEPARAMLGVGSCFFGPDADPRSEAVHRLIKACWQTRVLGSAATRGALIASGALDVSIAGRSDRLWDSLPGVLLTREAGGVAIDLNGKAWQPCSDSLVLGNEALVEQALGVLSP
jgi:myo-inositol-1(or 4)-monophosphatase